MKSWPNLACGRESALSQLPNTLPSKGVHAKSELIFSRNEITFKVNGMKLAMATALNCVWGREFSRHDRIAANCRSATESLQIVAQGGDFHIYHVFVEVQNIHL